MNKGEAGGKGIRETRTRIDLIEGLCDCEGE